ncbi:MAG: hypothetical protein ISS49_07425 [Anaerolineae bacterium]|nr:hypothetical protein [Anaerolineae bacterium]
MSPGTALHEAGHIVLAETFGYLTLAYYLGGQNVSLYYFDEERFIRGIASPLCVIGMGGYAAELLFGESVDLAGCAYDFERVIATYDEQFVSSLLPNVRRSSLKAVDAMTDRLTAEQWTCLYVAYDRLVDRREACLGTANKLQQVPAGAKWSNDTSNRVWEVPNRPV